MRGPELTAIVEPFLATDAFGFGARVSVGFAFGAIFAMEDEASAVALTESLRGQLDMVLQSPMISLLPIGPALRRININHTGNDVNIAVELTQERVDELMTLAERAGVMGGGATGGAPARPTPAQLFGPGGPLQPRPIPTPGAPSGEAPSAPAPVAAE